jgi:hypothetical protein
MNHYLEKLRWSLPWLLKYPFWRTGELARRLAAGDIEKHLIVTIANHFEPAWSEHGFLDIDNQRRRIDEWCELAITMGEKVRDCDGVPYKHTNFYPAEQYERTLLQRLAGLQALGLGEVEIHLHHGVEIPDTPTKLRRTLEHFRDTLAEEHQCLSRMDGDDSVHYAFVHGNLALANSAGGQFCGVDCEMQILADTGCYADLTLPSAPQRSQVPKINSIYECGYPLHLRVPHRSGANLRKGTRPKQPVILAGPLVFNWRRRVYGIPIPRLDDGVLARNYELNKDRLLRWANTNISVRGRPEWIFIKLYCHGFFPQDQDAVIGETARRFWQELLEYSAVTKFKIHFATAREAFNIAMAAVDGHEGEPGLYRDYLLTQIMRSQGSSSL